MPAVLRLSRGPTSISSELVAFDAELPKLCPEHHEPLKLWSGAERALACVLCTQFGPHSFDTCAELPDAADGPRKELWQLWKDISPRPAELRQGCRDTEDAHIASVRGQCRAAEARVHALFDELTRLLDARRAELVWELRAREAEEEAASTQRRAFADAIADQTEAVLATCRAVATAGDIDVVVKAEACMQRLRGVVAVLSAAPEPIQASLDEQPREFVRMQLELLGKIPVLCGADAEGPHPDADAAAKRTEEAAAEIAEQHRREAAEHAAYQAALEAAAREGRDAEAARREAELAARAAPWPGFDLT